MKNKLVLCFSIMALMVTSVTTFGQRFIPSTSYPPITMVQKKGIDVVCEQGSIGTQPAFSLNFQNNTNHLISFRWVLKDMKGNVVYSSSQMQVMAGQILSVGNIPAGNKTKLVFPLTNGATVSNYTVEIY